MYILTCRRWSVHKIMRMMDDLGLQYLPIYGDYWNTKKSKIRILVMMNRIKYNVLKHELKKNGILFYSLEKERAK